MPNPETVQAFPSAARIFSGSAKYSSLGFSSLTSTDQDHRRTARFPAPGRDDRGAFPASRPVNARRYVSHTRRARDGAE
jgi:hypothetical protein